MFSLECRRLIVLAQKGSVEESSQVSTQLQSCQSRAMLRLTSQPAACQSWFTLQTIKKTATPAKGSMKDTCACPAMFSPCWTWTYVCTLEPIETEDMFQIYVHTWLGRTWHPRSYTTASCVSFLLSILGYCHDTITNNLDLLFRCDWLVLHLHPNEVSQNYFGITSEV